MYMLFVIFHEITLPTADIGPEVKYTLYAPPKIPALKSRALKKFTFEVNETYSSINGGILTALAFT